MLIAGVEAEPLTVFSARPLLRGGVARAITFATGYASGSTAKLQTSPLKIVLSGAALTSSTRQ
jgi:hypothetical protein